MEKFVKRSDKVAYFKVSGDNDTFHRMTGFTGISVSKNPKEYKRQYVDQAFEQSDIVGFAPVMSFTFDQFSGNLVHDDIVLISDNELTGDEAVREIVMVDFTNKIGENTYKAVKREFSVIVESEGDDLESYKIKGYFKAKGEKVFGEATVSSDLSAATFISK